MDQGILDYPSMEMFILLEIIGSAQPILSSLEEDMNGLWTPLDTLGVELGDVMVVQ